MSGHWPEGKDAVHEGLINEVGGLKDALNKLHEMINERNKKRTKMCNDIKTPKCYNYN